MNVQERDEIIKQMNLKDEVIKALRRRVVRLEERGRAQEAQIAGLLQDRRYPDLAT